MSRAIVVMGVSGSGKSTLGAALATALDLPFVEGDALHPPENIARMAAGIALDDAARAPFLRNIATALADRPGGAVASCSALRRRYRDAIRAQAGAVHFVLPIVSRDALTARLQTRAGHFMPLSLLDDQLATLELPDADEAATLVNGAVPVADQVATVLTALDRPRTAVA